MFEQPDVNWPDVLVYAPCCLIPGGSEQQPFLINRRRTQQRSRWVAFVAFESLVRPPSGFWPVRQTASLDSFRRLWGKWGRSQFLPSRFLGGDSDVSALGGEPPSCALGRRLTQVSEAQEPDESTSSFRHGHLPMGRMLSICSAAPEGFLLRLNDHYLLRMW